MKTLERLINREDVTWGTALALRRALTEHYSGHGSIAHRLDIEDHCSESTYYRWENRYPELVEALQDSARLEALRRIDGETLTFQASMNGVGAYYDNAPVGAFFGTLKTERVHHRTYGTRTETRIDIFSCIEGFCNHRRIHTSLGSVSPMAYEQAWRQGVDTP